MSQKRKTKLKGGIENSKGMIVMQFSLHGCHKCGLLNSNLRKLQEEEPNQFELHEIIAMEDGKENPLATEHGIQSVPTVIIWKDGLIMDTMVYPLMEDIKRAVKLWGNIYDRYTGVRQKEDAKPDTDETSG